MIGSATVGDDQRTPARNGAAVQGVASAGQGRVGGRLYVAAETIAFIGLLNALILVGALAGGVLFGIAPAASAAASTTRARLSGRGGSMTKLFLTHWRSQFIRANLLQAPGAAMLALLGINIAAFSGSSPVLVAVLIGAATVVALYQVMLVSMDAHYELSISRCLLSAGRFIIHSPASPLLLAATLALIIVVTMLIPGLLPFISLGSVAYFCTALCLSFFAANEKQISA